MVNNNQNEKENDKIKISPLGIDEINTIIKSFKNSSFNKENLYKKDTKNFVKKSLFDLAKESENDKLEEKQSKKNFSGEKNELEKNVNNSEEGLDEIDNQNNLSNIDTKNHFDDDKDQNVKIESEIESNKKSSKIDEISEDKFEAEKYRLEEEKIKTENRTSDDTKEKQIIDFDNDVDQKSFDNKKNDSDKIEYEEKTIEALDSVREAVTKSLDNNIDVQNEEIEKNKVSSQLVLNEALSEINYINALFKNIRNISDEEIGNVVKSKVIELAEDVVGYQIEKFPEKFLKKIKNKIKEIKSINDDINIYLNDQDYEILNKFVESHKAEINFNLDFDSSLGRGDFTIDMGGLVQSIKYKKVIE